MLNPSNDIKAATKSGIYGLINPKQTITREVPAIYLYNRI